MEAKKDKKPKMEPTRGELEILQIIWEHGPSTVRFINDKMNEERRVNYTTTLRLMQIMTEKGILLRDDSELKHVFRSAEAETQTKNEMTDRFLKTLYNGSVSKLVMQWMGNKKASTEELEALRKLIDDHTKK
jgi:BlaI family transcriptional regulator, penicillinase repressor